MSEDAEPENRLLLMRERGYRGRQMQSLLTTYANHSDPRYRAFAKEEIRWQRAEAMQALAEIDRLERDLGLNRGSI